MKIQDLPSLEKPNLKDLNSQHSEKSSRRTDYAAWVFLLNLIEGLPTDSLGNETKQDKPINHRNIENLDQIATLSELFKLVKDEFEVFPENDSSLDKVVSMFVQNSIIPINGVDISMDKLYYAFVKNENIKNGKYTERFSDDLKHDPEHKQLTQILEENLKEILTFCKTELRKKFS